MGSDGSSKHFGSIRRSRKITACQLWWSYIRLAVTAIVAFNRISRPSYSAHAHVAACYAELHQSTEAQQHTTQVIALFPTFSTERYAKTLRLRDEADREHIRAGMLRAGLPH